jgi:predicted DNA-binding transcriptional regulator YafY
MSRVRRCPARTMSRSVLTRIYAIDHAIALGRCPSVRSLATELEVSTRTIERDLEQLRDHLGAPLVYDRRLGGYRYAESYKLPQVRLTAGEIAVLLIGQELLSALAGTPWAQAARQVMAKLPLLLGDYVSIDIEALTIDPSEVSFGLPRLRGDEESVSTRFSAILDAISARRTVELRYYAASRNEETVRKVDPYHLRMEQGAWYVIGRCHTRGDLRIFALDRIRDLTVTSLAFTRPPDFSIESYLRHAWDLQKGPEHRVVVEFDEEQSRWIRERTWQDGQKISEKPDGGVVLELNVTGLEAIQRWIMSYGSHARVLDPPQLVDSIRREAEAVVRSYADL